MLFYTCLAEGEFMSRSGSLRFEGALIVCHNLVEKER